MVYSDETLIRRWKWYLATTIISSLKVLLYKTKTNPHSVIFQKSHPHKNVNFISLTFHPSRRASTPTSFSLSSLTAVKLHSVDPHLHWASLRRSSPSPILTPSHTSPLFLCMSADPHRRWARPPSHRSRASTSPDRRSTSPLTLLLSLMLTVSNALSNPYNSKFC